MVVNIANSDFSSWELCLCRYAPPQSSKLIFSGAVFKEAYKKLHRLRIKLLRMLMYRTIRYQSSNMKSQAPLEVYMETCIKASRNAISCIESFDANSSWLQRWDANSTFFLESSVLITDKDIDSESMYVLYKIPHLTISSWIAGILPSVSTDFWHYDADKCRPLSSSFNLTIFLSASSKFSALTFLLVMLVVAQPHNH